MRILITGISGFIGGHLLQAAPPDHEIWGTYLDNLADYDKSRLLRVDFRDREAVRAVIDGIKPDIIIHCAAYSRVSFCEAAPTSAWEINSLALASLAALCVEKNIRLILLSSDMVFNGEKGAYTERDFPNPINFYGWTKVAAERRVSGFRFDSVIVRINLVYGPAKGGGISFSEEVINTIKLGERYYLFKDQYRSFISAQNLAACLWELALSDYTGIIHLGGPESVNRVTFADKLADRIGLNKNLLIASTADDMVDAVSYPKKSTFDVRLAQSVLQTPLLSLDEGLSLEYPA
jgi:dTDP-4-dehydrorhamnose reductase